MARNGSDRKRADADNFSMLHTARDRPRGYRILGPGSREEGDDETPCRCSRCIEAQSREFPTTEESCASYLPNVEDWQRTAYMIMPI